MQIPASMAVLTVEPSTMRAHWIAGGLENAGIPAHVEEDDLADEFSAAQRLLGTPRVRVLVPADRLEEARTVFLGMSQPLPLVDEDEEDDEAALDESSPYPVLMVLAWACIALIAAAIVYALVRPA